MLRYGPRVGAMGLLVLALVLAVIGAVLNRSGLEIGAGLLIVLGAVAFLTGRR